MLQYFFIDFSSAFNTIQTHIILKKLLDMNVTSHLILWIYNYLSHRPQYMTLQGVKSSVIFTNTGAPQGCVLSPLLFTLHTSNCCSSYLNYSILKYVDDTVIVGKICSNSWSRHLSQVEDFIGCYERYHSNLNVKKKEGNSYRLLH